MCMFCAALPLVASVTVAAQGEQRKKMQSRLQEPTVASAELITEHSDLASHPTFAPRGRVLLTPRRISQIGALAFVLLLFGSGYYHTHFPG